MRGDRQSEESPLHANATLTQVAVYLAPADSLSASLLGGEIERLEVLGRVLAIFGCRVDLNSEHVRSPRGPRARSITPLCVVALAPSIPD